MVTKLKQKLFGKKPGDISHVLYRARLEQAHRERAYILAYQNTSPVRARFSLPKRTAAAIVAFVLIVTSFSFINFGSVQGSTFTFSQTDWAGGTDGGTYPVHPGNQTGWNKYDSKDAAANAAAGNLALTLNNGSNTQTSTADFTGGTPSNVTASNNSVNLSIASTSHAWSQPNSTSARTKGSSAWDSTRGRMYVFGSSAQDSTLLAYTAATGTWTTLASAPSGRELAAMAYDSTNDKLYVFGGAGGGNARNNQLWSYNPVSNSWTTLSPTGGPPAARAGVAGAWDNTNGRFYITGGDVSNAINGETWYYTPSNNTWTQAANGMGGHWYHGTAWDSTNNQIYVYGGYNSGVTGHVVDLWALNTATNTWSQKANGSTTTAYVSLQWDPVTARLLSFGGRSNTANSENNTVAAYNPSNNTWATLSPSGTAPVARHGQYTGMDAANGKLYIFGGTGTFATGSPNLSDTFIYATAGNSWTGARPSARNDMPGAWDIANNKFYVFGGYNGSAVVSDFWSFDPATGLWSQISATGGPPTARFRHTMVWDTQNSKFWVFGGCTAANCSTMVNDLWSYTPSTNTWAQASPTGTPPSARYGASYAWDSTNNKMYVFGGNDGSVYRNDLFTYTPGTNTWATLSPTGGPPGIRNWAAAAWASSGIIYLSGGYNGSARLSDLWTYTIGTNTWAQVSPTGSPGERTTHNGFYDEGRSRFVIFGGITTGGAYSNTVYAYTPSNNTWAQISPTGSAPGARAGAATDWNLSLNKMFVFGGSNGTPFSDEYHLTATNTYQASGTLTSSAIDTGQNSTFSTIAWNGSTPTNTTLRFQIRTASTSGGLSSATFLGPTGSGDYYTSSGAAINSSNSGLRWVQYRLYLDTTDTLVTSTLNDVTINYIYYPTSATLIGSAYNTSDTANVLARLEWTENLPAGTDVQFQVRTTVNNGGVPGGIGDYMYAIRGNSSNAFDRYSISGNSWSSMAVLPTAATAGSSLVYTGGDYIYAIIPGTNFYRYSISGNSWTTMAAVPGSISWGGALLYISGDYIYAFRGGTTDFYRYSISGNSWTSLAATPAGTSFGASLAYPSTGDYIYATRGAQTTDFWRYSISGNSWTSLAATPANIHAGGRLVYPGSGDYLYTFRGELTTSFFRYSISGNSWTTMAAAPAAVHSGGSLAYPGGGDYIYGLRGNVSNNFYRYSISGNSWASMTVIPGTVDPGGALVGTTGWTGWMGPDGTGGTYFTDPSGGETMPAIVTNGVDDQWIQYKVTLSTTDTSKTPTLSDLTMSYVVNAAPTVTNVSATQGSNGVVTVGYDLTDSDSSTATVALGLSYGATLSGGINNSVTSLTLSSATNLPASGAIFIDNEEIQYASKTGNVLNSLTRGRNNSVAATHSDGAAVFFKAATVSGNVGAAITTGNGKSITWTIATDLTAINTSTAQVKVIANDGNLANQIGAGSQSNVSIDLQSPSALTSATAVSTAANSATSVTVTWSTNESSNSFVDYGTTVAYGTTASNPTLATNHSVLVSGLTASTLYYFRIRSVDAFNNTLTDDNGGASYTFTTPASDAGASRPIDETPPVITNIVVSNIATNGVTISWTTDEEASSLVNHGLDNTYGSIAGVPDIFTTAHTVTLSGLIPATVYHYQVLSLDRNSNRTASADAVFTTASGSGSGIGDGTGSGAAADALEAAINALTNENNALSSQVDALNAKLNSAISEDEAGRIRRDLDNLRTEIDNNIRRISELSKFKEENEGLRAKVAKLEQEMSDITTKILGLKDGENLNPADLLKLASRKFNELARVFKLQATIEERTQIEEELTDTTNTLKELTELVPPPRVMTRPAIEVTSASAMISWTTDKPTFGSVLYGDDATFRANRSYVSQANDTNGLGTSHSITVTGLAPATVYHYQIAAKSEAGAETNSADFTFTTKTASPIISNGRVIRVNDSTLQVLWQTTLPSNSVVTYTPYVSGALDSTQSLSEGKPEPTINHNVTVTDLKPATTYDIEISSTDAFGNTVTDRLGRIVTSEDKIAPVISQVRTEISVIPGSQNRVQVIISWKTDEPATTQVFYSPGAATGAAADKLGQASNLNNELTYNHIAVITNWEPGVIYRFRAVSKDETGNEAQSKTFTVLTPRQKATVVDLIIDNFTDIFGWTKGSR